jgi:hypothetical protein
LKLSAGFLHKGRFYLAALPQNNQTSGCISQNRPIFGDCISATAPQLLPQQFLGGEARLARDFSK